MSDRMKKVAIVGATGAVGREMIHCLEALEYPVEKLILVASERSVGKKFQTSFGEVECELISDEVFEEAGVALFSAGSGLSREWRERVCAAGCLMIDNSSAFRYEEGVPLVIPQINAEAAHTHKGVIANPNCTTAIAAMALWPLHKEFGLTKVIVSTYQATSGAGAQGMAELEEQTRQILEGKEVEPKIFQHQIAFNLIPHIDSFQENDYTKEEMKVTWETRKIFGDPHLKISCTAVRIPILRAHSESIEIETEKEIDPEKAREVLKNAKGVELKDNPGQNEYPMPLTATNKFDIEVGRVRQSLVFEEKGICFFVSGDQLLRGAALNAVEIAKLFV